MTRRDVGCVGAGHERAGRPEVKDRQPAQYHPPRDTEAGQSISKP